MNGHIAVSLTTHYVHATIMMLEESPFFSLVFFFISLPFAYPGVALT